MKDSVRTPSNIGLTAVLWTCLALNPKMYGLESLPESRRGMVVCADSLAAGIGVEILRQGGNAIDAAVGVAFALAVTYPEAGNIGGGGFMLIRLASGKSTMIDFRETGPMLASPDRFLDNHGDPILEKSRVGPLAVGVPGTVSGLLMALGRYGSMDRKNVLDGAIQLAEHGFRVGNGLAASLQKSGLDPERDRGVSRTFFKEGKPLMEGELLRQPDLAETLGMISEKGEAGFYAGEVAELVTITMGQGNGIMTREDLAGYRAIEREPLTGSYRGDTILTASPPSAGGIIILQMLNMLEQFDLSPYKPHDPAVLHLIAATAQRAFADRSVYAGDPSFSIIPTEILISKPYARERVRSINPSRASTSAQIEPGRVTTGTGNETTHLSVVDEMGNAVSATISLNDSYGAKVMVEGAGFLLNNTMDDFVIKPGSPNLYGLTVGEQNSVAPGRRMVSSMCPTIVLREGKPHLILGARGGSRIPTALVQVIVNVVDFNLDLQDAVDLPRIHHQWVPDILYHESGGFEAEILDDLRRRGYSVDVLPSPSGRVQVLQSRDGFMIGAPDRREGGAAIGF